jgi:hypothetical protein
VSWPPFFSLCFFLTTQSVESEILIIIKCLCFHSSLPKPCWIMLYKSRIRLSCNTKHSDRILNTKSYLFIKQPRHVLRLKFLGLFIKLPNLNYWKSRRD